LAQQTLYAATLSGKLLALNAETGKTLWVHSAPDAILSGPTLANGLLLFGCNDSSLYALHGGH
jgi:outer membrane protein assembly factor BamB